MNTQKEVSDEIVAIKAAIQMYEYVRQPYVPDINESIALRGIFRPNRIHVDVLYDKLRNRLEVTDDPVQAATMLGMTTNYINPYFDKEIVDKYEEFTKIHSILELYEFPPLTADKDGISELHMFLRGGTNMGNYRYEFIDSNRQYNKKIALDAIRKLETARDHIDFLTAYCAFYDAKPFIDYNVLTGLVAVALLHFHRRGTYLIIKDPNRTRKCRQ